MFVNVKNLTLFHSFGVEHIPKETKKFIGNRNITTNIYRMLAYDSAMSRYFWIYWIYWFIGFIDCMLKGKRLLENTNLLSLDDYEKNDKIIKKLFLWIDWQKGQDERNLIYEVQKL